MSSNVVMFALNASLWLFVFSVALRTRLIDAAYLVRHPALVGRAALSVNVIMPLLALCVAIVFPLDASVKLALVVLAMSPVPPFLPLSRTRTGDHASFAVALLAAESLLAIVFIPLTLWLVEEFLAKPPHVPSEAVTRIVITSFLIPFAAGTALRQARPWFAERMAKPVAVVAMVAVVVGLVPLVSAVWRPMLSLIGNGTVLAIVIIPIVGLGIGHVLGGPAPADRPVLAIATASRHPAVAIAILAATVPTETLAPAAVVLALIAMALASLPYTAWVKRELEVTEKHTPLLIMPVRRVPAPNPGSPPQHPVAAVPARRRRERRP